MYGTSTDCLFVAIVTRVTIGAAPVHWSNWTKAAAFGQEPPHAAVHDVVEAELHLLQRAHQL